MTPNLYPSFGVLLVDDPGMARFRRSFSGLPCTCSQSAPALTQKSQASRANQAPQAKEAQQEYKTL